MINTYQIKKTNEYRASKQLKQEMLNRSNQMCLLYLGRKEYEKER